MKDDLLLGGGMSPMGPKVDPRDYETLSCTKCGHKIFETKVVLKKIPGTVVGNGTEPIIYPLQVLVCSKCGKILDEDIKAYKLEKDFEKSDENIILT